MHDRLVQLIEVVSTPPCVLNFYRTRVVSIRNKHLEKLASAIFKRLRRCWSVYILSDKHVIGVQFLYHVLGFLLNR